MRKWKPVYAASLHLKDYAVSGSRLVEDAYYGEYGMADFASELPLDEYELCVESWENDPYCRGGKIAGPLSNVRMEMQFPNKEEANSMWKYIKENRPNYAELERLGFHRIP